MRQNTTKLRTMGEIGFWNSKSNSGFWILTSVAQNLKSEPRYRRVFRAGAYTRGTPRAEPMPSRGEGLHRGRLRAGRGELRTRQRPRVLRDLRCSSVCPWWRRRVRKRPAASGNTRAVVHRRGSLVGGRRAGRIRTGRAGQCAVGFGDCIESA